MKIVHRNMKEGAIIVVPESLDDLWHLEKIIANWDFVSGTTFRHIKIKGTGEKTESRTIYIKILVDDVSFQEHSDKLRVKGVIKEAKPEELSLAGLEFVLTGKLESFSRSEAEAKIKALGGKAGSDVTRETSYVVVGTDPGSKLAKAEKLGIKKINEAEFLELLNQVIDKA